jgi:AraC-like DNA-binding protein
MASRYPATERRDSMNNFSVGWFRRFEPDVSGGEVKLDSSVLQSFYLVVIPLMGQVRFRMGEEEFYARSGSVIISSPGRPLKMWLPKTGKLEIIGIEWTFVRRVLSGIVGRKIRGPINFDPVIDLTEDRLARWYQVFTACVRYCDQPADRLVLGAALAAQDSVVTALLQAQKSNHTYLIEAEEPLVPASVVMNLAEVMERYPEWGWKIREYALIAGVSVRAIQKGFLHHLGITPSRYLRDVRLERARDALRASWSDRTTVRAVPKRFMFHNFGRFSAWYRKLFGESPWETFRHEYPS